MTFEPLTKEDIIWECDVLGDGRCWNVVRESKVFAAVEGLKADMFDFYHEIGRGTIWRASNDEVADLCEAHALKLVDKWFPVFVKDSLSQAPEHEYTEGISALASVKHGSDAGEKSGNSLSQPSGVEAPSVASEVSQQRKRVDGEKTLDFFEEKHGVPAGELSSVSVGEVDVKHAARKGCNCKHGSGAITERFVEENKLCKCECHKNTGNTSYQNNKEGTG